MSAKMVRSAPQPPFRVPRLRPVACAAGGLARTRQKRKNSSGLEVHMGNPGSNGSNQPTKSSPRSGASDTKPNRPYAANFRFT